MPAFIDMDTKTALENYPCQPCKISSTKTAFRISYILFLRTFFLNFISLQFPFLWKNLCKDHAAKLEPCLKN